MCVTKDLGVSVLLVGGVFRKLLLVWCVVPVCLCLSVCLCVFLLLVPVVHFSITPHASSINDIPEATVTRLRD